MIDRPFRVERSTRLGSNGTYGYGTSVSTWAIVRTGVGTICTCDDVSWAYIIVGLLNDDEATSHDRDGSGDSLSS